MYHSLTRPSDKCTYVRRSFLLLFNKSLDDRDAFIVTHRAVALQLFLHQNFGNGNLNFDTTSKPFKLDLTGHCFFLFVLFVFCLVFFISGVSIICLQSRWCIGSPDGSMVHVFPWLQCALFLSDPPPHLGFYWLFAVFDLPSISKESKNDSCMLSVWVPCRPRKIRSDSDECVD